MALAFALVSIAAIVSLANAGSSAVSGAASTPSSGGGGGSPSSNDANPVITTACGPIMGAWAQVGASSTERVAQFRSIPYAKPPVGSLRWAPPAKADCWSGTLDARLYGNFCAQGNSGTEDCLQLTVTMPERVYNGSSKGPWPVMFYIHGGGLMGGSMIWERPEAFTSHAGQDQGGATIVVTMNYRLNVFGFLTVSEFAANNNSGVPLANFGIMDQQLALQWTQDNIGFFGGDKKRVTLNGQSSGGTSIMALLSSPLSKGLFSGAISLSGSPNMTMAMREQAWPQNAPLVDQLGCGASFSPNASVRLACLKNRTQAQLQAVVPASFNTPGLWGLELLKPGGMDYSGLPIVDGVVIADGGFQYALADGLIDVPVMYGNLANECDVAPDLDVSSYSQQQWQAYLNSSLQSWNSPTIGPDIYAAFQNADPMWSYSSLNTAYGLTCGSIEINAQAAGPQAKRKAPLYFYYNNWPPSHPVLVGLRYAKYPYHGLDWDWACEKWPAGWTPTDQDWALSKTLQSVWWEFMANGGRLNATATGWKTVDDVSGWPNNYNVVVIEPSGTTTQVNFAQQTCQVLASYGFDRNFWWVN